MTFERMLMPEKRVPELRETSLWRNARRIAAVHVLQTIAEIEVSSAVAVPLAAGEMTFHHPRTLHYAGPNRSCAIRRAWANEFQTAPVRRDVPADHPWVAEGKRQLESSVRKADDG